MSAKAEMACAVIAWTTYLGGSVFGHVALKRAAGATERYDVLRSFGAFASAWGLAALVAWILSAWAWTLVLTRHRLVEANAISAWRVVLCALAAWLCLGERLGPREIAGTALVAAGVWLLRG